MRLARTCVTLALSSAGCGGRSENADQVEPVFPANFEHGFKEARPCFLTHEHDLRYVKVFANALAYPTYTEFEDPYPVGATIVKVEYENPDGCEGIVQYTAIEKRDPGTNTDGHDWWWQRVSTDRRVLEEGAPARCIACHSEHCEEPNGYDLTCKPEASGF